MSDNIHRRCWDAWGIVTGKGLGRKLQGTNLDTIQKSAVRTEENWPVFRLRIESQTLPM